MWKIEALTRRTRSNRRQGSATEMKKGKAMQYPLRIPCAIDQITMKGGETKDMGCAAWFKVGTQKRTE